MWQLILNCRAGYRDAGGNVRDGVERIKDGQPIKLAEDEGEQKL